MKTIDAINRLLSKTGLRLERTKTKCAPSLRSAHEAECSSGEGEKTDMQEHEAVLTAQSQGKHDAAKESCEAAPIPADVLPSSPEHKGMDPDVESPRVVASGAESPAAQAVPAPTPPSIPAHEELARIRREMPAIFERTARRVATGELGLIGWGLTLPRVQKLAHEHEGKPWFFIGDIHGDFLAWVRLFDRIRQEKEFRLCFLGDLVDRGPLHMECFAALMEAVEKHPNQILWILGNHDEGVGWSHNEQKFATRGIEPAQFVDWLNNEETASRYKDIKAWGQLFTHVVARLPRAALFEDGLLATHGGVPLRDRWETLLTMEAFHHERCLGDFTWVRFVDYPPRKLGWKFPFPPNRAYSSTFQMGYLDVEEFATAVKSVFPVKRIVRGHDHVEKGSARPACFDKVPVLTINGFGFDHISDSVRSYRPKLTLGVAVRDELPKVEEVPFLPEEHALVYPDTKKPGDVASSNAEALTAPSADTAPGSPSVAGAEGVASTGKVASA